MEVYSHAYGSENLVWHRSGSYRHHYYHCLRIEDKGDSANVLVVGILTVVSLFVVIISTTFNSQVVDIMKQQEIEITKQRETAELQWKAMTEQRDIMQGQLDAANTQIRQTKELFEKTYRPSLGIENIFTRTDLGQSLTVEIIVKNSGQAPAKNVKTNTVLTSSSPGSPYDCPSPSMQEKKEPLSRGVHPVNAVKTTLAVLKGALSEQSIAQIRNGNIWLYLWIFI
jgi:hypothetical protein